MNISKATSLIVLYNGVLKTNFSENVAKFIDHVKNIQSLMIEKPSDKREYPITKYVAAIFQVKSTEGNAFTLGSRYPLDIYDS